MNHLKEFFKKEITFHDKVGFAILPTCTGVIGALVGSVLSHPIAGFSTGVALAAVATSAVLGDEYFHFKKDLHKVYDLKRVLSTMLLNEDLKYDREDGSIHARKVLDASVIEYDLYHKDYEKPFVALDYNYDSDEFSYRDLNGRWVQLDDEIDHPLDNLEERIRSLHRGGRLSLPEVLENDSSNHYEDDVTKKVFEVKDYIRNLRIKNIFTSEQVHVLDTVIPKDLDQVLNLYSSFSDEYKDRNRSKVFDMISLIEGRIFALVSEKEDEKENRLNHLHTLFENRYKEKGL